MAPRSYPADPVKPEESPTATPLVDGLPSSRCSAAAFMRSAIPWLDQNGDRAATSLREKLATDRNDRGLRRHSSAKCRAGRARAVPPSTPRRRRRRSSRPRAERVQYVTPLSSCHQASPWWKHAVRAPMRRAAARRTTSRTACAVGSPSPWPTTTSRSERRLPLLPVAELTRSRARAGRRAPPRRRG
jgi:hypothetical protein